MGKLDAKVLSYTPTNREEALVGAVFTGQDFVERHANFPQVSDISYIFSHELEPRYEGGKEDHMVTPSQDGLAVLLKLTGNFLISQLSKPAAGELCSGDENLAFNFFASLNKLTMAYYPHLIDLNDFRSVMELAEEGTDLVTRREEVKTRIGNSLFKIPTVGSYAFVDRATQLARASQVAVDYRGWDLLKKRISDSPKPYNPQLKSDVVRYIHNQVGQTMHIGEPGIKPEAFLKNLSMYDLLLKTAPENNHFFDNLNKIDEWFQLAFSVGAIKKELLKRWEGVVSEQRDLGVQLKTNWEKYEPGMSQRAEVAYKNLIGLMGDLYTRQLSLLNNGRG